MPAPRADRPEPTPNRCAPALAAAPMVALLLCRPTAEAAEACRLALVDPAAPVDHAWERHDFVGHSIFRNGVQDGIPVIEAVPAGASALFAKVEADIRELPVARWRWRVERLQPSADLRRSESEDFSGVVLFGFGDPSPLHPDVPTLAYAWTATPVAVGTPVRSPRHPDRLVTIKLEGEAAVGTWRDEERDLLADYRAAFGREPAARLGYVALVSDNDQTGEPALTWYGAITLSACRNAP